jgi:hypothetical protein
VAVHLEVQCAWGRGVYHSRIQQFSIAATFTTYSDDGQSHVVHAVGDYPVLSWQWTRLHHWDNILWTPPSISCSHYQLVLDTLHCSRAKERTLLCLWVMIRLHTWHRRKFHIRDNQLTQGARITSQFQKKMGLCWACTTITSNCKLAGEQYIPKVKLEIKFLLPQSVSQGNASHLGIYQEVSLPVSAGWVGVMGYWTL